MNAVRGCSGAFFALSMWVMMVSNFTYGSGVYITQFRRESEETLKL